MQDCARCGAPLVYVTGMPSECVLMCTICGMRYYSESWAEAEPDESETQENLRQILAFRRRLKRQPQAPPRMPQTSSPSPQTVLYGEGVSCKLGSG